MRGVNLREDLGRSALRAVLSHPALVLRTDDVPYDLRDLHARLAKLNGTPGIVGAETHVQEPHAHTVSTGRLYVKARVFRGYAEKKYKGLIQGGSGAFGNAATRIEAFAAGGGTYAHGGHPDVDGLFPEQATGLDPKRREATLHRLTSLSAAASRCR